MNTHIGTVGIIIPMYNARATILRAVQSVMDQTYTDWHIYLINDRSSDDSLELVQQTFTDARITILCNEVNRGAAATRNVGLRAASEPFIAFLDSDDQWQRDKLMLQVAQLAAGDNLVISDYDYHSSDKSYAVSYGKPYLKRDSFVKKKFRICFSSVCYRRPPRPVFFQKRGHEDFLFLHQLFLQYQQARVINQNLVTYFAMDGSLSRNKNRAAKWHFELLKLIYKNNPFKVCYYYAWYMVNGVLFAFRHR